MIAKTTNGKGFGGLCNYLLDDNKRAEVLHQNNVISTDPNELARQYRSIVGQRTPTPVWHTSLSFDDRDNISDDKMVDIANKLMEKSGFNVEQHQWSIIKHNDTKHSHIHIVANRVGFDNSLVSNKYNKSKTVRLAQGLEKEYNLHKVQDIKKSKIIRFVKDDTKKENTKAIKGALQAIITKGISKSNSILELKNEIGESGAIDVKLHQRKSGEVFGISYAVTIKGNKLVYKGSQLGKQFTATSLNKHFNSLSHKSSLIVKESKNTLIVKESKNTLVVRDDNDTLLSPQEPLFPPKQSLFSSSGDDGDDGDDGDEENRKKRKKKGLKH